MPLLRVNLLGEFSLFHAEQRVTSVKTPRLQSLLAYLLLHRGSQLSRLHVASLYWPDSNEAQARTNLRQLLHFLRRSLPDAERFLQVETNSIMWKSDNSLLLDVALFEDLLLQAGDTEASTAKLTKLIQAVDLYKGELLPGCFDEWILSLRDRYSESYIGALQQLTRLLEEKANYEAAIQYTRRLLQADPLEEKAYRRLMRLYVRTGDRNRALRTYHAGVEMLKQDLGVEPEPETRRDRKSVV